MQSRPGSFVTTCRTCLSAAVQKSPIFWAAAVFVWTATQEDVPYPGLNVPYLIQRLRRDLSGECPITWEEVFAINRQELGVPAAMLEQPIPGFTFAIMQLVGAYLVRRHPGASVDCVLAAAQTVGEIASEESAYGPPDDEATYREAYGVRHRFKGNLMEPPQVDHLLAEVERACLA